MIIRRASVADLNGINKLLYEVLNVHRACRPDLFKANAKKYTDKELKAIIKDYNRPVFVAAGEHGEVLGYAFCVFQRHKDSAILQDRTTLYVDDLCVDENARGQKTGSRLLEHVFAFAKAEKCYNVTLNVWNGNDGALSFYQKFNLTPQKTTLEKIL